MISESASGDDHGAESRRLHSRSGHLGDDDGADHVDCIGVVYSQFDAGGADRQLKDWIQGGAG